MEDTMMTEIIDEERNEVELVKFFLKKCGGLEKIIIKDP